MNLSFCDLDPMVQRGKLLASQRPQANVDFTVGYVVFGFLFDFACLALWLWFKPQYERTRVRPTMFVVLAVLCSLFQMSYGSVMTIFSDTYPCFLGPLLLVMSIPFAATSVIGRLILYAFLSGFSSAVSNNLKNREDTGSVSPSSNEVMSTSTTEEGSRALAALVTCWLIVKRIMYPTGKIHSERELYVLKFLLTNRGILTMALFFSVPIFIVILAYLLNSTSEQVYRYCSTCAISSEIAYFTIVFLVLFWALGLLDWLLLTWEKKKIQRAAAEAGGGGAGAGEDYWGLKTEAFAGLLASLVTILGFILTTFDYSKIYPYSHLFMLSFGLWLLVASQTLLQIYLARRTERTLQTTNSVVAIDNVMLLQVLQDPTLCQQFEQHLVAEFAVESLYFLKDVAQWENSYYNIAATARTARARKIYKSYIAITGLYSVNVSSEVNQEIRLRGGGEGSPAAVEDVPVDLFQKAKVEISLMLITGALLRFYQAKMKHTAKIEDLASRKQDASRPTALASRAST